MLITEKTLASAIERFLKEAHVPRPSGWTVAMDILWVDGVLVPAFYKALQEIEEVNPCYGFDLKNIHPNHSSEWHLREGERHEPG